MYTIKKDQIKNLLEFWGKIIDVYAPTKMDDVVDLVRFDKDRFTTDFVNFTMPFKEYLFGQKEKLFRWKNNNGKIEVTHTKSEDLKPRLFFGLRPCDTYSVDYLDLFFYERFRDDNYAVNREKSYIVALNCTTPGETCYCSSMGTGPFAKRGYDLMFTPIGDGFLVEVGNDKGMELISMASEYFATVDDKYLSDKEQVYQETLVKFVKQFKVEDPKKVLAESFDNEVWKELSRTCMGCTGCTSVCPTCTCFNVVDENKNENEGWRARYWDSCQSDSFTRNAGGHNPRDGVSRVRYRVYDKMKYIDERFDLKGCVGCGRCIDTCPALLDITEIMQNLDNDYKNSKKAEEAPIEIKEDKKQEGHECSDDCSYVYTPKVAIIKEIIQETSDIKRFVVQYEDKSLHEKLKYIGQFFKITVFGVGEIAISIPSGDFKKDYFEFYIKKAGKVTTVLHNMKVGDKVGLRGPFGKGFPHEEMEGRDILIVGSGVGLAPVRTTIERVISNRDKYGEVVLIASARSYESLIYREDLIKWSQIDGVQVLYALAKETDKVDAHVGYVNELLHGLPLKWENTTSILCASPNRIKSVAQELIGLGLDGKNILTSLETHMRCGIGKCGHCKVGSKYMCVDGPVFTYEEMLMLPPEF